MREDLVAFAEELEATAETHRCRATETEDALVAAENRGISRAFLFIATKIRVALIAAETAD